MENMTRFASNFGPFWRRDLGRLSSTSVSYNISAMHGFRQTPFHMAFLNEICDTCKKRRVKCDGTRPNCGPCQQTGRICFGLEQSSTDFIFVVEPPREPISAASTKRKKCRRKKHADNNHSTAWQSNSAQDNMWRLSILPHLETPLEDQAISYYFGRHLVIPDRMIDIVQGYDQFMPLMYMQARANSAFCLAILAISYGVFGNRRRDRKALAASINYYSKAISKTKETLNDIEVSCSDQALLATLVLSLYETIAPYDGLRENKSDKKLEFIKQLNRAYCHHDGTAAILQARTQRGLPDERSMILDKFARRHVLRTRVLQRIGVPRWLRDGAKFGEEGLSLDLDRYMIQVAQIEQDADQVRTEYEGAMFKNQEITKKQVSHLLQESCKLGNDISQWQTQLPSERQHSLRSMEDQAFCGVPGIIEAHTYSSPVYVAVWNRVRTVQVLLKSTEISLLSFAAQNLGLDLNHELESVQTDLQAAIGDVCATIPYSLNDFSIKLPHQNGVTTQTGCGLQMNDNAEASIAGYLAFPLHAIMLSLESSGLPQFYRQWIREQLLRVGRALDATLFGMVDLSNMMTLTDPTI